MADFIVCPSTVLDQLHIQKKAEKGDMTIILLNIYVHGGDHSGVSGKQ